MDRGPQATSDCGGDGHGDAETHGLHLHMRIEVEGEQGGHTVRSGLWRRKLAERGCGGRHPSLKHAMIQAVRGWRVPGKDCYAGVQRASVQRGTTERLKPLPLELASQSRHAQANGKNRYQIESQEALLPSWRVSVVSSKGYSNSTPNSTLVLVERQLMIRIGGIA